METVRRKKINKKSVQFIKAVKHN